MRGQAFTLPLLLAACSAPSAERPQILADFLAARFPISEAGDVDLSFRAIPTLTVEVSRIALYSGDRFVAFRPDPEGGCYDILPSNAEVAEVLGSLVERSNVRTIPQTAHFRMVFDATVEIPARRGSYQMIDDEFIISSSAWYLKDGRQVFLSCPEPGPRWLIYQVAQIERL